MSKQVGIRLDGVPTLAELLYFDEVALVPSTSFWGSDADRRKLARALARDKRAGLVPANVRMPRTRASYDDRVRVGQMLQHGLVVPASKFTATPDALNAYREEDGKVIRVLTEANRIIDSDRHKQPKPKLNRPADPSVLEIARRIDALRVLPWRRAIEKHPGYEPTTINSELKTSSNQESIGPVLEVVLSNLPTPALDTPIEAIVDFRSDEDATKARKRLHRWMREIATKGLSPRAIEDELESLLDDYTEHMRLHKMKYEVGILRTFITVTAEVLENLPRLKFKAAIESVLKLFDRKIALTDAELKTPGRDVAYLVQANEQFGT